MLWTVCGAGMLAGRGMTGFSTHGACWGGRGKTGSGAGAGPQLSRWTWNTWGETTGGAAHGGGGGGAQGGKPQGGKP